VWWFSVVDVVQVLTQQADYQTARKYWNKLKERLSKEGSESVTDCHRLKLPAADGKNYLTDVASAKTLLRLVQSVPSPKAGPIKLMACAYCVRRFWKKNEQFSDVDIR
jgi:DNA-damage-inducible protein D